MTRPPDDPVAPSPGPPPPMVPVPVLPLGYASGAYVLYESAAPRARWLLRCMWAGLVVQVLFLWPTWRAIVERCAMARGEEPTGTDVEQLVVQGVLGLIGAGVLIVVVVLWMMWVHRTYRNLPALGADGLRFSPGWAVAYYFIPIVNLFRPFQVMRETWRASHPLHAGGTSWRTVPVPALVNWWWAAFATSTCVSLVSAGLEFDETNVRSLLAASWLDLVTGFLDIGVLFIEMAIVVRLTSLQEERAGLVSAAPSEWPVATAG